MVMMTAVTFVPPEKPLPGAELCCQLLILVWDFLPSSGSPFIGLFCVKMFSLLLALTLVSDARVAERKRQNKLEGSFHLTTAFSKFLQRWSRRKLVMMVLMMTMIIKMKLMIMRTNIIVNEGDEVVVSKNQGADKKGFPILELNTR